MKKRLIPELEQNETNQGSKENSDNYRPLLISLYGLSTIDSIQERMYSALLEKYVLGEKDGKLRSLLKNASLFGTKIIKAAADFFSVGESMEDIANHAADTFLSAKKDSIILIFDDIERCQVDIVELMGFLNNLCENCGYRVIIIANEKEISKKEDEVATAIQKQTALLDLYGKAINDIKTEQRNIGKDNRNTFGPLIEELKHNRAELSDTRFKDLVNNHRDELFEKNTLYERTREKLIGLTIHFESNVEEAYEDIAKNTLSGDMLNYLIQQKELVVEAFTNANHQNLRTLISVFIASEGIISLLEPEVFSELKEQCVELAINTDEMVNIEKQRVLFYIVKTAIQKAENKAPHQWKDTRFGSIGSGFFIGKSIVGYAFVDEYWTSLVADRKVISLDFSNRIIELLKLEIQKKRDKEHSELSLFKLSEWYLDKDEKVEENIRRLKTELAEKKYYPQEFKDIICTLIRINNPNFGMSFEQKDSDDSNRVYDAIDDSLQIPEISETETVENAYNAWDEIRIEDYINLMIKYFDGDDVEITKEMLRMLTTDAKFAKEYRQYIQPIIARIEEREIQKLKTSDEGIDLLKEHNSDLFEEFRARKDKYLARGQFLTLYGYDTVSEIIANGDPKTVFNLADAINVVYSFGNLRDFFANDYEIVNKIWSSLKAAREGKRETYNKEKSRTKEIALRRIEADFLKYRNSLKDPDSEGE